MKEILDGIEGEYVLVGPEQEPAIVIHDDMDRLCVKLLGPTGALKWIDASDFSLVIENAA